MKLISRYFIRIESSLNSTDRSNEIGWNPMGRQRKKITLVYIQNNQVFQWRMYRECIFSIAVHDNGGGQWCIDPFWPTCHYYCYRCPCYFFTLLSIVLSTIQRSIHPALNSFIFYFVFSGGALSWFFSFPHLKRIKRSRASSLKENIYVVRAITRDQHSRTLNVSLWSWIYRL